MGGADAPMGASGGSCGSDVGFPSSIWLVWGTVPAIKAGLRAQALELGRLKGRASGHSS